MYATVAAAAALHQVLLRSLGEDKVIAQNVASGLFCVLFVALGVVDRPALLGTGIATPSSRRRVDGVEEDATIQHERAVKF